jgi:hypothetical protein
MISTSGQCARSRISIRITSRDFGRAVSKRPGRIRGLTRGQVLGQMRDPAHGQLSGQLPERMGHRSDLAAPHLCAERGSRFGLQSRRAVWFAGNGEWPMIRIIRRQRRPVFGSSRWPMLLERSGRVVEGHFVRLRATGHFVRRRGSHRFVPVQIAQFAQRGAGRELDQQERFVRVVSPLDVFRLRGQVRSEQVQRDRSDPVNLNGPQRAGRRVRLFPEREQPRGVPSRLPPLTIGRASFVRGRAVRNRGHRRMQDRRVRLAVKAEQVLTVSLA